ncbi:MAG TPA: sulfatase-like hydrolase/transferase [Alphaproteobacteria bacterium]|nr:sulfatase-like hydrolase/transferase [Alphaproteobacteria bacterium]
MSRRPNFLLFITDQQRADHLGCYGNPVLRTPHIDGIAARGSRFERFYVACAICMPNRATLMTGRMPSLHGVRYNGVPLSLDAVTFVDLLRAAGYRTSLIGKSHLQNFGDGPGPRETWKNPNGGEAPPEELLDAVRTDRRRGRPYDSEWTPYWLADESYDVKTPFYGFDHVRLCTYHGDRVHGHYTRWLEARHPGSAALRGADNAEPDPRYMAPQAYRTRVPEELYPTSYIADMTCDYLEDHARAGGDAPFFIQCSFPDPHHPFTPPGRYWDMYDPADIPLPPSFGQNDLPPMVAALHEATRRGAIDRSWVRPFAVSEREAREIIALTYGMIAMIDDAVGRVLAKLQALGLDRDTVVIFTSDHGDWMGDHGIMLKGPIHYQGLIRVPFLWADPATRTLRPRVDALSGTVDIASTVLDRAGLAPFNGIQGESLLGAMRGEAIAGRRGMMVEQEAQVPNFGLSQPPRVRTLVTERWRLSVWGGQDFGELYDLASDPHEMTNLWADPAHAAVKAELLEQMVQEMIRLANRAPLPTAMA